MMEQTDGRRHSINLIPIKLWKQFWGFCDRIRFEHRFFSYLILFENPFGHAGTLSQKGQYAYLLAATAKSNVASRVWGVIVYR